MKVVSVRFINESNILSDAIQWDTWGRWSHVEFIFSDGYFGSRFNGGVKLRPFDYIKVKNSLECHVEVSDDQYTLIYDFLKKQDGKPYDKTSILGFIIHRDWKSDDSWFCSELVAAAFLEAGIALLRTTDVNRISPRDLSLSPLWIVEKETRGYHG